ncbi:MAG: hypothetical protein ACQEQW_04160 [Bacteroidota bacterium]
MMKRIVFLFAITGLFMSACTDDLQKDIDELKEKVEALEATDVASLDFQGSDLVVTFGDGSTSSVTVPPEVIPNRVIDFEIDNATGIITVTFSDGTTKEYIVLNNGNTTYLSGTLTGDFGIASMSVGDVKMAELSYDDQNRMVEALINLPDGNGNVINIMEMHNYYSAENPVFEAIEKALRYDMDYFTEAWLSSSYVYFPGDSGNVFVQEDGELYDLYIKDTWYTGTDYRYNHYEKSWFVPEDEVNYDTYEKYYPVPGEDSLFYKSYNSYYYLNVDGVDGRVYYPDRIIKITQIYEPGQATDTTRAKLTMRDDDLIEKVEFFEWDSDEIDGYMEMTYDASDLITKVDMYDLYDPAGEKGDGINPDTIHFAQLQMSYTDDLLTKVDLVSLNEDGTVAETTEITEIVYDEVGNPVEIWAIPGYDAGDGYIYTTDGSGKIIIEPLEEEMTKIVEIEYDYMLPNFFGKTLEYMIPELKGLKITNAPVKLTHSGFFDFVNMEYFDFNEGGYPAKVKMEAYISTLMGAPNKGLAPGYPGMGFLTTPIATEMLVEYVLFE